MSDLWRRGRKLACLVYWVALSSVPKTPLVLGFFFSLLSDTWHMASRKAQERRPRVRQSDPLLTLRTGAQSTVSWMLYFNDLRSTSIFYRCGDWGSEMRGGWPQPHAVSSRQTIGPSCP